MTVDQDVQLDRLLGVVAVVLLTLFWASPVNAATPAFDLHVDSQGSSVEVTVRFQQAVSTVEEFEGSGVLDRLIGVLPADQVDEDGRPLRGSDPRLVSLEPVEGGVTYQGSIRVDDGEWAFFPWPGSPSFDPDENPGAPATEFVTVEGRSLSIWLAIGAVAIIGVATVVFMAMRDQLQPRPTS